MEQNLKKRYEYIEDFFDSLSDNEFVDMLFECGLKKTKKTEDSAYIKAFYPSTTYKVEMPVRSDNNSYSEYELKNKNFEDVA